ncbi:MAG TPA: cytochrome oxidase subunit I, partial [Cytophagales bacterium]|nr:cytochrome oxidase subunit I [Cytophagales bacterium]
MENNALLSETGIIITLVLIVIPVIAALLIVIYKIYGIVNGLVRKRELEKFNEYFKGLSQEEVKQLEQRKRELEFA